MPAETGFRDLFVELPLAVFEALQGIGEAAVHEAQRKQTERQVRLSALCSPYGELLQYAVRTIGYGLGWCETAVYRSDMTTALTVRVRLGCGHVHRFEIDELRLAFAPNKSACVIDAVYEHADERSCCCIPRE